MFGRFEPSRCILSATTLSGDTKTNLHREDTFTQGLKMKFENSIMKLKQFWKNF